MDVVQPVSLPSAAVALIVAARPAQLLFIRRAAHPLDPWSGHVALPGGRVEPGDASPLHAAIRESFEEVGIALEHTALRTSLVPTQAFAGSGLPRFQVTPHVFRLETLPALTPALDEVAEAFWMPLSELRNPERQAEHVLRATAEPGVLERKFPAWNYEGRVIWGLTYAIVRQFLEIVPRFGDF